MSIKKIALYITLASLFLIPIFPLIVANSYFFPFITGKAFFFRILVEVGFAAWIILAFLDAKYRPKITALTISVTVFALVALLADLLGVNPIRSLWSNFERMEGWVAVIHLWAFYIVSTSMFGAGDEGRKWWHRWMLTSLVIAFIVGCYGLLQMSGAMEIHQGSSRVDASLGNSAYLAVYMFMNAFFAVYLFFARQNFQRKHVWTGWLYSLVLVLAGIEIVSYLAPKLHVSPSLEGIIFILLAVLATWFWRYQAIAVFFSLIVLETQTRGTILGLAGAIALAFLLYALFGKGESQNRRRISGGIVIGLVVLAGIFWALRHQPFIEKNPILGRFSNISWNEASNQARQYIWPMALKGAMDRPILGWGQENFNYIFNANYNPAMYAQEQWFDRAHNVFLDWLTAAGLLGLIAYLSLYVLFLRAVWRSGLSIAEKSALTGLLAGYFVHNVFVFDNLASYAMFFAALGFVNSLPQKQGTALAWFGTKPVRQDAVEYIVTPITIVLLVGALYFINVRPIEANTRLITALSVCGNPQAADPALFENALNVNAYVANQEIREQLYTCAGNVIGSQQSQGPTKTAFYNLAKQAISDQIAATPKDARVYVLGGALYNQIGQFQDAYPLLQEAHVLSPGKQTIDFELATAELNLGKNEDAVNLLKKAYEDEPDFFQAKNAYAISLVLAGREAEAHQLFGNDPSIFQSQQMANVYAGQKQYGKAIAILTQLYASSTSDVNLGAQLAQLQFLNGQKSAAVATLKSIEAAHPELKDQIEQAIKQVSGQ